MISASFQDNHCVACEITLMESIAADINIDGGLNNLIDSDGNQIIDSNGNNLIEYIMDAPVKCVIEVVDTFDSDVQID